MPSPIPPKDVDDFRGDEKAADAHPEAISESSESESDDESGEEGGDEDDEGFCGEEVKEEPHDPGHECGAGGAEVREPVGNYGEE